MMALPPDDATLAAHEMTRKIRDTLKLAKLEEEQEEQPERAAMGALASVLDTRAVEPKEKKARISRAKPVPTKVKLPETPDDAYRLMDAVFKKWSSNYAKNPHEANRELARDLGSDTAIYLRAQILRLPDMLDAINKLGMLKAEKSDYNEGADMEIAIEDLRAMMRGSK